ncbi:hypothetical protein ACQQ2T_15510 (plasmid) [Paraclostridium tenue]
MKQIFITLVFCLLTFLTGCSNKEFDNAVNKGNIALSNKEYVKAESNFRLALSKKNDPEIFKLTDQTSKIVSIQQYQKDKNYSKALDLCNELEKEGFVNDLIKNDVINLKEEIEKDKKLNLSKIDQESTTVKVNDNKSNKDQQIKQPHSDNNDDIDLARATIYQSRELSYKEVDVQYQPPSSLGTAISDDIKNNYYIFLVEDLIHGITWDTYIIVDKTYFTVNDMDMYGNIQ